MSKIIDPEKLKRQDLQDEFVERLNQLYQNALWRGLTRIEAIGLIDTFKTGAQLEAIKFTAVPGREKK